MGQVSRPLQIMLLATLLFAVAWFLVLRPRAEDAGGGGSAPAPAAQEAPAATADGTGAQAADGADSAARGSARSAPRGSSADGKVLDAPGPLGVALRRRQAVALAFVDPRTADARAVREEIRHVSRFGGRAIAFSVPISQLSRYRAVTRGVNVTVAPTVVIIAPDRTATTIVGFTDRAEIEQGLANALGRG